MTALSKQTSRVRRGAALGVLLAVPLLPLAACGDGEGNGGQNENEQDQQRDDQEQEDEGDGY